MKKLFIYSLFLLIFTILFIPTVLADVIPPNSHSFDRCVRVVNLDKFSDITLIGYYTGPMVDNNYETYQIENNKCLTKGYKFNTLKIYWNTKDKADSIDINKLLIENIEPYGGYVDENNPLLKEDIEYSLAGSANDKLILYKSKQTSEYNDGTPTKVETYVSPLQDTQPEYQDQKKEEVETKPSLDIDIINSQSDVISESVVEFTDDKLVSDESKQTSEYNDGAPTKVETYVDPLQDTQSDYQDQKKEEVEITPSPNIDTTNGQSNITHEAVFSSESEKKGFWQSIICFFNGLFGKGC